MPPFFFFNDTATTEIYTLSLHDALPISWPRSSWPRISGTTGRWRSRCSDRKSTRLNSSHGYISYAVFCLKKKKDGHRLDQNSGSSTTPPKATQSSLRNIFLNTPRTTHPI